MFWFPEHRRKRRVARIFADPVPLSERGFWRRILRALRYLKRQHDASQRAWERMESEDLW